MSTRINPGHPGKRLIQPWEHERVAPQAAWTSLFVASMAQWIFLAEHRWQRDANFMFKLYAHAYWQPEIICACDYLADFEPSKAAFNNCICVRYELV
jgi:hypothetical protein